MNRALKNVADEISRHIVLDLRNRASEQGDSSGRKPDEMAIEVAQEVTRNLDRPDPESSVDGTNIQERVAKLEKRLVQLARIFGDPSQEEQGANLPNLKYAGSKYRNVDSLLNYIESKDAGGGLKLVIMNFND